jgi:hypothetical protein
MRLKTPTSQLNYALQMSQMTPQYGLKHAVCEKYKTLDDVRDLCNYSLKSSAVVKARLKEKYNALSPKR